MILRIITTKRSKIILGLFLAIFLVVLPIIYRRQSQGKNLKLSPGDLRAQSNLSWPDESLLKDLEAIKRRLANNFFPSPEKDGSYWLSVSQGQYNNQFYS